MPKSLRVKEPWRRSRSKTLGVHNAQMTNTIHPPTGADTVQVYNSQRLSTEVCNDIVTPGFQQLVAGGTIVNNPFSKVSSRYTRTGDDGFVATRTDSAGVHTWSASGNLAIFTWGWQAPIGLQRINQDNLVKLAQTAALAGVQAPINQSLVSIAELGRTLRMIVSPGRMLRDLLKKSQVKYDRDLKRYGNRLNSLMKIRSYKARSKALAGLERGYIPPEMRGDPKSLGAIGDALAFVPEMVLSYNLGWKPLMMEIDNILNKIPALEEETRRTSRATKSDSTTWSETKVLPHSSGNVGTFRYDYEEELVVRAGVLYADGFNMAQHFGVQLRDVPAALWELIPFSFVLDYVINVEQFVNALSVSTSQAMKAYFTKVTIKTKVSRTWLDFAPASPWTASKKPAGVETAEYEATLRWPDSFTAQLAHTPLFDWTYRPPAQLQNVLSLLTMQLLGVKTRAR